MRTRTNGLMAMMAAAFALLLSTGCSEYTLSSERLDELKDVAELDAMFNCAEATDFRAILHMTGETDMSGNEQYVFAAVMGFELSDCGIVAPTGAMAEYQGVFYDTEYLGSTGGNLGLDVEGEGYNWPTAGGDMEFGVWNDVSLQDYPILMFPHGLYDAGGETYQVGYGVGAVVVTDCSDEAESGADIVECSWRWANVAWNADDESTLQDGDEDLDAEDEFPADDEFVDEG